MSLFFCWPKRKVTKRKCPTNAAHLPAASRLATPHAPVCAAPFVDIHTPLASDSVHSTYHDIYLIPRTTVITNSEFCINQSLHGGGANNFDTVLRDES